MCQNDGGVFVNHDALHKARVLHDATNLALHLKKSNRKVTQK